MKGKHDSVNEWRTLLLTGDCFVLDAMWVRNLATSIENVDWPDWLPSSWLADCPAPGWLKMDLDERTWTRSVAVLAPAEWLPCLPYWLTNQWTAAKWMTEWMNKWTDERSSTVGCIRKHTHTYTQTDTQAHTYTVTNSKCSSGKSLLNLAVTVVVRSIQ